MAIIKGTEVKFSINLTAPGFDMDSDDFEIAINTPGSTALVGAKGNPDPTSKVRIFKEGDSPSSSSSSSSEEETGEWFVIVETDSLKAGVITVLAKAYIPDPNAKDLIRTDIAKSQLDTLVNP